MYMRGGLLGLSVSNAELANGEQLGIIIFARKSLFILHMTLRSSGKHM